MAERSPFDYGDRIGRLEGIIEQINDRLGNLEARMNSLESNLEARMSSLESNLEARMSSFKDSLEARMSRLESSHRRDFRWLVGTMIGMWVTTMGLLLTITIKVFAG